MKYDISYLVVSMMAILLLLSWGCNKDSKSAITNTSDSDSSSAEGNQMVSVLLNSESVTTTIYGDPEVPAFEYVKVGSKTYNDLTKYIYKMGRGRFGHVDPSIGRLNPATVEVKTSVGALNGAIRPCSPMSLSSITRTSNNIAVTDSLGIGKPLTFSWPKGNADFYFVYGEYESIKSHPLEGGKLFIGFTTDTSITFPGSSFPDSGLVNLYGYAAINGPLPKAGARSNLSGKGSGFLYYSRNINTLEYIGVGMKLSDSDKPAPKRNLRKALLKALSVKLK